MVKKLRKKFVVTAMLSLLLILVIMIGVINAVNMYQSIKDTDQLLNILADNDGMFPGMMDNNAGKDADNNNSDNSSPDNNNPNNNMGNKQGPRGQMRPGDAFDFNMINDMRTMELPFQARYFMVKYDSSGEVIMTDVSHVASVTEDDAVAYASSVYGTGRTKGFKHTFRYKVKDKDNGDTLIIFLDRSSQLLDIYKLLTQSLLVGAFTLIAMFILVYIFSGQAVAPVVESLEKQKRFITDAGHELKTPLAVISANVDVLELEAGKSEWSRSIKNQVLRMNDLVKNMLTLSRMDEERINVVFSEFDLSATVKETAASFEALATSKGKTYDAQIADGIFINGDRSAIVQLASLLLDNAIKYSSEKGVIHVLLSEEKNITFEVSNTCDAIPDGNLDRLFDRFYRADSSRARETGGYGIGLSVARAIATSHGGEIKALRDGDKIIRFVVTLPKHFKAPRS